MNIADIIKAASRHGAQYLESTLVALIKPAHLVRFQTARTNLIGEVFSYALVSIWIGVGFQRLIKTDLMAEYELSEFSLLAVLIIGMWLLYCGIAHHLAKWFSNDKIPYSQSFTLVVSIMASIYLAASFFALITHVVLMGLDTANVIYRIGVADTGFYWLFHFPAALVLTTLGLKSLHGIPARKLLYFVPLNLLVLSLFEAFGFTFWLLGHAVGFG